MSSNSYELGWAPRQRWGSSTRAQRAAERRAELAGSLAAADELVTSSSAAVSAPGDELAGNKWQSISALERSCNFNRLKKGYASVRKSFRLPDRAGNVQAPDGREELERPRGLVGQLGVGAARLLRGVYQKGRQQHLLEADSIGSTTGSFKVLTPSATYSLQPAIAASSIDAMIRPKKSTAELDIELRLQRSKGRVLPSASYTAPQSDKACDGLNLEELEEIKRDNLRLTLSKSQTFLRSERRKTESPHLGCSCKALEPGTETKDDYCCCQSISSSFSSSLCASRSDLDLEPELEEFVAVETNRQDRDGDSSRASGGFVGDKIFHSMEEIVAQGGARELEKVCGKPTLASSPSRAQPRRPVDNNCDGGQLGGVGQKSLLPARAEQDSTTKQHANGATETHLAESDGHGQSNECDDHQSCRVVARPRPKATTVTTTPTSRVVKGGKVVKAARLSVDNVHNLTGTQAATFCDHHVADNQSVEIISQDEEQQESIEAKGRMMFHEQRRGNYLEEPMYGSSPQQQQLQEQHLYASISSSPHTPSPSHQHHYEQHQHQWRRMSQDYDYGERQLYEKQLHHLYPAQRDTKNENKQVPKKSLFSRIKHLIIAPAAANNNQQTGKGKQWDAQSVGKQQQPHGMRWQKSATLNSRSAQNLLGSSLRAYLSTSRKSINLAELNETAERESGAKLGLKPLTSGFFTLGRRGLSRQVKPAASQLFAQSGSVDSLPSADSGMSCGNLQAANSNSSDENYSTMAGVKSQANPYWQASRSSPCNASQQQQVINERKVIGRARAKVDCNPCAYDKEALVFKCGDIIEILERNQSGTWVGRCSGQVGHFKFINVTELPDEREPAEQERASYVTKLEIRNNRMELQQQPSFRQSRTGSCSKPSSTAANQQEPPQALSMRSSKTETNIMSSLEQLLFAIGLADERVGGNSADQRNQSTCSSASSKVSYLDILDRGGIRSLDSFSEINDWHELEQMGIQDDEHRRRLLMAARIIRQASMAAKLDFVENYRSSKSNGGSSNNNRQTNDFDQTQRQQQRPHSYRHQQQEPRTRNSIRGDVNEPIYVNLVNGSSGGPIVCDGAQVEREVHDLDQANGWQPSARHHQHAGSDGTSSRANPEQNVLSSARLPGAGSKLTVASNRPSRGRQAGEQQHQQADFYIQNSPIGDSINQVADHYRAPSNWLAGRDSRSAGGIERGTPVEGGHCRHRRLHYQDYGHQVFDVGEDDDDNEVCNVDNEDDDEHSMIAVDGTSPLVRGYSMRVSRRSRHHPKNNNNIDLNGHHQDLVYCHLQEPPPPPLPVSQSRNRFHDVRGVTSVGYTNLSDYQNRKPQSVHTIFNPNGQQLAPAARVAPRIVRASNKQEIGDEASLGSQFNSKSAYDLRLDLSHFFS